MLGWPDHACHGCSLVADQVAHLAHLNARDTTLAFASRAPQPDIARVKARMGWTMPWYTMTDEFDVDFGVDEWHGTNAFIRDGDRVFRTYFVNNRGDEAMGSTWSYLDMTALGRQEDVGGLARGLPADPAVRVVELARRVRRAGVTTAAGCRRRGRPPAAARTVDGRGRAGRRYRLGMAEHPARTDLGRRVWALFTPYHRSLVLIVVAVLVSSGLGIVTPFLTQAAFDHALFPAGGGVDIPLLAWLVAGMVAIPVVSALIGVWQTYLTTLLGNRVMADLRSRLFAHLQRMDLAFFTATRTGAIQSRLANDVGGVQSVLSETASSILSNVVTVVAALVAMLLLSWQLTLVAVALLPVFVLLQVRVGRVRRRIAGRTQESLSDMTAITEESLSVSGVLLAKVFNRQAAEVERYTAENARQVDLQVRQAMTGQSFFAVVQTFLGITPALVYLVAGFLIAAGRRGCRRARSSRSRPCRRGCCSRR